jgi:hypothetical protein
MKGGTFDIPEVFIKILSTGLLAFTILAAFFGIQSYHLILLENKMDRESLNIGNAVLSSCIAEVHNGNPVKGLLSEEKINREVLTDPFRRNNIHCLNYNKGIYIEIYDENGLSYRIGNSMVCENPYPDPNPCEKRDTTVYTIFPAALNKTTEIIPVTLKIFVGVI